MQSLLGETVQLKCQKEVVIRLKLEKEAIYIARISDGNQNPAQVWERVVYSSSLFWKKMIHMIRPKFQKQKGAHSSRFRSKQLYTAPTCLGFRAIKLLSLHTRFTIYCPIYCELEALKLNSGRRGLVWPVGWRVFMWRVESTNTEPIKQNAMPVFVRALLVESQH